MPWLTFSIPVRYHPGIWFQQWIAFYNLALIVAIICHKGFSGGIVRRHFTSAIIIKL